MRSCPSLLCAAWSTAGNTWGSPRSASASDQQTLPLGRRLGQFGHQRVGDLRAGQFHGRPHGCGGQGVVRTTDGFHQEWNAVLPADEDRAPQSRCADLRRCIRQRAQAVVDGLRSRPLAVRCQCLGAAEKAFADGELVTA